VAALLPTAVSLVDAALGQVLGTGVAGAGAGLVAAFNPAVLAPGLTNIKKTLSSVAQSIGPSLGIMLAQFGKFVQGFAPQLAKLFSSSLPFMKQFFTLMEIAARTILPALTTVLKQMVSSGALQAMTQGLVFLIQAIASLIVHIGPGLKAGALVFRAIMIGLRDAVYIFADAWGFLGKVAGKEYSFLHSAWDNFRHWFASSFDAWRHWWASSWFQAWDTVVRIWHDIVNAASSAWDLLVKAAKTGIASVVSFFTGLPGRVLRALFGLGHQLYAFAHAALSEFWSGLKAVAGSVISWVSGFVHTIWDKVKSFFGISSPSSLFYDIGKNLMLGLFHGIKDHAHRASSAAAGAAGAVSGAVSGQAGAAQRYARSILGAYGWAGQWNALNAVAMRESGWSLIARNPNSGAYGIAQFINGPSEYYQYGGNPNTVAGQVIAFFNYIRQRYGNPGAAWQHEVNFGWYDKGGWLPPGLSLAYNTTGRPERVLSHAAGGPVTNVYLTVQVGHGTHPVAAAQEIVKLLNVGARNGVRLRSSILGPG
jgi:hypothetical protein